MAQIVGQSLGEILLAPLLVKVFELVLNAALGRALFGDFDIDELGVRLGAEAALESLISALPFHKACCIPDRVISTSTSFRSV